MDLKKIKKNSYSMKEVTEELELPFGKIKLLKKLRELGILYGDNTINKNYYGKGYFESVEKERAYSGKTDTVTLVTQEGLRFIKLIFDQGYLN
jgi:phage antirepressor YoqD-like protein